MVEIYGIDGMDYWHKHFIPQTPMFFKSKMPCLFTAAISNVLLSPDDFRSPSKLGKPWRWAVVLKDAYCGNVRALQETLPSLQWGSSAPRLCSCWESRESRQHASKLANSRLF